MFMVQELEMETVLIIAFPLFNLFTETFKHCGQMLRQENFNFQGKLTTNKNRTKIAKISNAENRFLCS